MKSVNVKVAVIMSAVVIAVASVVTIVIALDVFQVASKTREVDSLPQIKDELLRPCAPSQVPGSKTICLEEFTRTMSIVDIPEGVERITRESGGYYPDAAVETIKIPASVKHIDSHAIDGHWRRLRHIETVVGSPYVVTSGCLIDTRDSTLVFALHGNFQITVPAFVKSIRNYAFEYNEVVEVNLPEGLEKIEDRAFSYCRCLEKINIPATVKRIGCRAFDFCGKLRSVDVSEGNNKFHVSGGFLIDRELGRLVRAFGDDEIMDIPIGVCIIGDGAFNSMKSLEIVKIPDSVEKVGEGAFDWCESLMRIWIPREGLRTQIIKEIRDFQPYGRKVECKKWIGVNGSPNLLPSQILVVGGSDASVNSPNNHTDNVPTKQKQD